jgi:hypothetical protein
MHLTLCLAHSPHLEGCQAQPDGVVLTGGGFVVAPTTPPLRGTPPEEGNAGAKTSTFFCGIFFVFVYNGGVYYFLME